MFIGEYNHTLDEKARVIIPMKYREELGETFYITKGIDKCLFVFAAIEWDRFREKLEKNGMRNPESRKFQRQVNSATIECNIDKQGRVLLTNNLREYAEIDKEITIIGVSNRVEIWAKEKWEAYNDVDMDMAELMENMENFDL